MIYITDEDWGEYLCTNGFFIKDNIFLSDNQRNFFKKLLTNNKDNDIIDLSTREKER